MKLDKASECGGCGSDHRWILHNVRDRGIYRRLCTSCVLKFHAGLFCPVCFEVYEGSSLLNDRVMCLNCPSVSHKTCVSEDIQSNYVCPSCSSPSFVFLDSNKKSSDGDGTSLPARNSNSIDLNSAKILVAAAKISSTSMSKAATAARVDAERRVKEAAFARKRAREALERVVSLGVKEKEKVVKPTLERVVSLGFKEKEKVVNPTPVSVVEHKKKPKGSNSAVTAAVAAQKRIQNQYRAVGNDKSGTVPVTSNNVREKERLVGLHAPGVVQKPSNNGAPVENMDELKVSSPVMGCQQLQSSDTVKEKKSDLLNQVVPVQKDKNGLVSAASFARHPSQNSHDMEKEGEKSKALADSGAGTQLIHSSQDTLVSK
ncbi:zinc finger protein [Macleaya cordata]|uniref:Zinc finger protein n=1 Tax=Macleaya cordata TaxID=56857 RepID=A0A200QSU9_MACCD|nr:zinc finger protein [Macleaya cordata]